MNDYRVKGLSDDEVRKFAKRAKEFFCVADVERVDVVDCLKRRTIWTVHGEKRLNVQIRPDDEMGNSDGTTIHRKGVVTIAIKQSVYSHALMGDGRARNTIAHEIGHAVLGHASTHDGLTMHRRSMANTKPQFGRPFELAEHQVKVFAPAFLINDVIAETSNNAEEISIKFGVSLECARIYFERLTELRNRTNIAEKLRRLASELRESQMPASAQVRFLDSPCTLCGKRTLFPVGSKFMCQCCNQVFDSFPDGDG